MVSESIKSVLRPLVRPARKWSGAVSLRLGRIASGKPLSSVFGYDRGTPIDRFYIEQFLAEHAEDVRGHVLEVGDDSYSRRFGGNRITRQDVLDVDASNRRATIIGDLTDGATLPDASFDCIILTQTLHHIYDMASAVRQIRRSLRADGVALITVPGITPVRPEPEYDWYWSLTDDALRRLLGEAFDADKVTVSTAGNLFTATAFLHGAAVEDVPLRQVSPGRCSISGHGRSACSCLSAGCWIDVFEAAGNDPGRGQEAAVREQCRWRCAANVPAPDRPSAGHPALPPRRGRKLRSLESGGFSSQFRRSDEVGRPPAHRLPPLRLRPASPRRHASGKRRRHHLRRRLCLQRDHRSAADGEARNRGYDLSPRRAYPARRRFLVGRIAGDRDGSSRHDHKARRRSHSARRAR